MIEGGAGPGKRGHGSDMRNRLETWIRKISKKRLLPFFLITAVNTAAILAIGQGHPLVAVLVSALIAYIVVELYMEKVFRDLDQMNERLLNEREIRQEFFSNASHELKTPITSIRGYAELLENDMVPDPGMQKDIIRRIKNEAGRMSDLITDILAVSKLEAHDVRPELMDINMTELIADRIAAFEPKAKAAKVTLCNYAMNHVHVYADYGQMEEIVSNLVSNAIRYNRRLGKVWVNANNENGYMILRVRDTGIGVEPGEQEKIFNRFYRVDKGRSRDTGGTGLGLSIVKHIVNYYGGSIELRSKPGSGSEFIVKIPENGMKKETEA